MSSSSRVEDEPPVPREGKPEWLDYFLRRTYFSPCEIHGPPKNGLNKYCIDCNLPACLHCINAGTHAEHRVLKIYRHVYKDTVIQSEMHKHMDCSNIQAYRNNRKLVIALNPLPHSGSHTNEETACVTCKRILMDPHANSYCSIDCKVKAFMEKTDNSEPPFLALQSPSPSSPPPSPDRSPKRPRKGVPHRSPLS